jgi:hypothetical protein
MCYIHYMQTNEALKVSSNETGLILGVNPPVSNDVYHGDRTAVSSSVIKTMYKDIAQYHREYVLGQKENKQSAALDEGSLAHTLILEPHLFASEYAIYPGFDKREAGFKAWKSNQPDDGKKIISASQLNKVQAWVKSFTNHAHAPKFVKGGEPEQTICALWNVDTGEITFDENTASSRTVRVKVRFDYINVTDGYISDVKTTREASGVEIFAHTAFNEAGTFVYMYDLSAALYLAVAEAYYGRRFDFYFIVLSKADVACDVYKLSDRRRAEGLAKINKALRKYIAAKESGVWKEQDLKVTASSEIVEI